MCFAALFRKVDVIELTVLNKLVSRPCAVFKCPKTAINSGLIKAESFRGDNLLVAVLISCPL